MKKIYTAPYIERNSAGNLNKYAHTTVVRHQDNIDTVPIKTLVEAHGSPLFVFSERNIRRTYRRLQDTIRIHYPLAEITWSYKTNYLGAICNIFHQEGAAAEVVSGMEYDMARRKGIPGERIYFNGPSKRPADLERAISEGAFIHIDHLEELYLLEKNWRRDKLEPRRSPAENGYRKQPIWKDLALIMKTASLWAFKTHSGGKLHLVGLHTHIVLLSWIKCLIWLLQAIGFAQTIKDNFGIIMEYIDLAAICLF
jgi:diaminopimelate decarboxylase